MASEPPDPGADHLPAWLEVLDDLTYYELFGVAPHADRDEIHAAFHAFCDAFHPDRHVGREPGDQDAVGTIFKRGTEAYIVLTDAALRRQYDEQLAVHTTAPPPRMSLSPLSRPPPRKQGEGGIEDAVRSPSARPFARRAEELIAKGDLRQAKLQLVMANHMDPNNAALEAALRGVEAKLGSQK
jgi:curved DNA-binding protein CbpA